MGRYQVFPTIAEKPRPESAWQVIDMTQTRTVASCYNQEDAGQVADALNKTQGS